MKGKVAGGLVSNCSEQRFLWAYPENEQLGVAKYALGMAIIYGSKYRVDCCVPAHRSDCHATFDQGFRAFGP